MRLKSIFVVDRIVVGVAEVLRIEVCNVKNIVHVARLTYDVRRCLSLR